MANLFEKRATEFLRDDEAFLAVVTPEPLATFLSDSARKGCLYDRLVMVIGTPGSGKTTLARLFQFKTLGTLLRNSDSANHRPLINQLTECGALKRNSPTLLGARIPLETEYRDFWEFPYEDGIKTRLVITFLQARTVLAWIRNIESSGVPRSQVKIIPRADSNAALEAIGGITGVGLVERAREVERAIYHISAALVPPSIQEIDREAVDAYRPFDVVEAFTIPYHEKELQLRPLIVFDDAHRLHPDQLEALRDWLVGRELKVGRWVLARLDALSSQTVLYYSEARQSRAGMNRSRETTEIWMQGGTQRNRRQARLSFRSMASDMANRYLRQMDVFRRRNLNRLGDILSTEIRPIPEGRRRQLVQDVNRVQQTHHIPQSRRYEIERMVDNYLTNSDDNSEDLRLAILAVLFERYAKRIPQINLFGDEPSRPLKVDAGVADGARIHLLHKYKRAYYFGLDTLCDASSENAEQFLRLVARIVSHSETQLINGKGPTLTSDVQHKLLRERANEIVNDWDFPECLRVRRLAYGIADQCLEKSLQSSAPLNGGANAFGIPQEEYEEIPRAHPGLAQVLRFGVAYNAFTLVPEHSTKNRKWCLIELGGIVIMQRGLTLKRGGFLERRVADLEKLLEED